MDEHLVISKKSLVNFTEVPKMGITPKEGALLKCNYPFYFFRTDGKGKGDIHVIILHAENIDVNISF